MQIKTAIRYHLTPIRMAFYQNTRQKTRVHEDVEKRDPTYTVVGSVVLPTVDNSMEVSQKTKHRTSIWSKNSWYRSKKIFKKPTTVNLVRHIHPNVHSSTILFTVTKIWEKLVSTNSWVYKDMVHTYCCCCSITKPCPTLCAHMDCSTPGFPVLHHLSELYRCVLRY